MTMDELWRRVRVEAIKSVTIAKKTNAKYAISKDMKNGKLIVGSKRKLSA